MTKVKLFIILFKLLRVQEHTHTQSVLCFMNTITKLTEQMSAIVHLTHTLTQG